MADWSKIGKRSKRKGKTYERRCAKLLSEWTGVGFRSTPASGGFNKQGTVIREEMFCGDLICDRSDFIFCIEAKNRESFNFSSILKNPNTAAFSDWWHQCIEDAKSVDKHPIMFFKPNNRDDFVAVTSEVLFILQYSGPMFSLKTYDDPIKLKIDKEEVEVKLPTPHIINWHDFKTKVDSNKVFLN